jgi:glycosyltransferase involved in cell wall biosynthesis
MRSLHVTVGLAGGAGMAAKNLVEALGGYPHAQLLDCAISRDSKLAKSRELARQVVNYKVVRSVNKGNAFTLFPPQVDVAKLASAAVSHDVLNLHWLPSISAVEETMRLKMPTVWTLHDEWPIYGGCHHAGSCEDWIHGCTACPQVRSPFRRTVGERCTNLAGIVQRMQVVAVAPSRWLRDRAQRTGRFSRLRVIPNPVSTSFFTEVTRHDRLPEPPTQAPDVLVIIAVATNWSDPQKGLTEIIEFCQTLSLLTELRLRLIGDGVPPLFRELSFVQAEGRIESVEELVDQYRSSHFLVSGSVAENLPNVLLEAQLVGLPCLVRRAGGVEDIVSTGVTGLVADTLSEMIPQVIEIIRQPDRYRTMAAASRETASTRYSPTSAAGAYRSLYRDMLAPEFWK